MMKYSHFTLTVRLLLLFFLSPNYCNIIAFYRECISFSFSYFYYSIIAVCVLHELRLYEYIIRTAVILNYILLYYCRPFSVSVSLSCSRTETGFPKLGTEYIFLCILFYALVFCYTHNSNGLYLFTELNISITHTNNSKHVNT